MDESCTFFLGTLGGASTGRPSTAIVRLKCCGGRARATARCCSGGGVYDPDSRRTVSRIQRPRQQDSHRSLGSASCRGRQGDAAPPTGFRSERRPALAGRPMARVRVERVRQQRSVSAFADTGSRHWCASRWFSCARLAAVAACRPAGERTRGNCSISHRAGPSWRSPSTRSSVGTPAELFRAPGIQPEWSVTADGQRFLVAAPSRQSAPAFTVVLNWQSTLKR